MTTLTLRAQTAVIQAMQLGRQASSTLQTTRIVPAMEARAMAVPTARLDVDWTEARLGLVVRASCTAVARRTRWFSSLFTARGLLHHHHLLLLLHALHVHPGLCGRYVPSGCLWSASAAFQQLEFRVSAYFLVVGQENARKRANSIQLPRASQQAP